MWFHVLSLVIGAALLGKATIALTARRRFYAGRQRQYATESLPTTACFGYGRRPHSGRVVRNHLSLPTLGLGRHGLPYRAIVHGSRPCVPVVKTPPSDARGGHEPEGLAG
jgi:hypothetical protein